MADDLYLFVSSVLCVRVTPYEAPFAPTVFFVSLATFLSSIRLSSVIGCIAFLFLTISRLNV